MGGGIAMACANAGLEVRLRDASHARLHQGLATIRRNYAVSVTRGRFTEDAVAERLARIHPQLDSTGFDDVDLIIEAVFEDLALKQQVFRELDAVARPGCILASNTSTLDIDAIASATSRPADVVGLHFFSPANVMRLLEIVRGSATSATVIAARAGPGQAPGQGRRGRRQRPRLCRQPDDVPVHVRDAVSSSKRAPRRSRWTRRSRLRHGDGHRSRSTTWPASTSAILAQRALGHFSDRHGRTPLVQAALVEVGRLGQKTGKGWYTTATTASPSPIPAVIDLIRAKAAAAGIAQRTFTNEEIVERAIYALVNEGARALDDGLALRASDIDTIYVNGYGFPAWRGGPMFYADRVGLDPSSIASRLSTASTGRAGRRRRCSNASPARAARSAGSIAPRWRHMAADPRRSLNTSVLPADMLFEQAADGTIRARSPHPLGPYPDRITDRLEHWAAVGAGSHVSRRTRRPRPGDT